MNAKEARLKSEYFNENPEYKKVISLIKQATENGRFNVNIYDYLNNKTVSLLENDGYIVDFGIDERNESYCYVNW